MFSVNIRFSDRKVSVYFLIESKNSASTRECSEPLTAVRCVMLLSNHRTKIAGSDRPRRSKLVSDWFLFATATKSVWLLEQYKTFRVE